MDIKVILGIVLITGVMMKELSYFTPNMIRTQKSIMDYVVVICGMLVLVLLTIMFANSWHHYIFAMIGFAAFGIMWVKQGTSEKGVLTMGRLGEFYPWEEIGSVKISGESTAEIIWNNKNESLIIKQRYAKRDIDRLLKRIQENGIVVK